MAPDSIQVEVVCAEPARQTVLQLAVPAGYTAMQAVLDSRVMEQHPGVSLDQIQLGIFGVEVTPDTLLQPGDRVEVLRPLPMDPRERRRLLARQGRTMGGKSGA